MSFTVRCDFCGGVSNRELDNLEYSCDHCEMATAVHLIGCDKDDLNELNNSIVSIGKSLLLQNTNMSGSVMPLFQQEHFIDESTLDILLLFFDKIILSIDGLNFSGNGGTLFLEKINAYVEAGYVIPIAFGTDYLFATKPYNGACIDVNSLNIGSNKTNRSLEYYLQAMGEFLTSCDSKQSQTHFKLLSDAWFKGDMKYAHPKHCLNRINGISVFAEVLQSSIICNGFLLKYRAVKYQQVVDSINIKNRASQIVSPWYSDKLNTLPKLKKPETLIEFRQNTAKNHFVNVVVNEFMRSGGGNGQREAINNINKILNENILLAKKIGGESYKTKVQILSGLITTLGSLVGGVPGAFIGGIGGTATALAVERLDRNRVAGWATYFIDD